MYLFRKNKSGFDLGKLFQNEIHVPIIWNLTGVILLLLYGVLVCICVSLHWYACLCTYSFQVSILLCFHVYFQNSVSHWIWNLSTFYPNDPSVAVSHALGLQVNLHFCKCSGDLNSGFHAEKPTFLLTETALLPNI